MAANGYTPGRGMLTSHGMVLLCLARDPTSRLVDLAALTGCTPRFVFKIVLDLEAAGMITRTKVGRRNTYTVHEDAPLGWMLTGTVTDLIRALR